MLKRNLQIYRNIVNIAPSFKKPGSIKKWVNTIVWLKARAAQLERFNTTPQCGFVKVVVAVLERCSELVGK